MSFAGSRPIEADDVVADTWDKIGCVLKPVDKQVFIRTEIPKRVTKGGIILTDKMSDFYYGLPNIDLGPDKPTAMTWGTVIAVGPGVKIDVPTDTGTRSLQVGDKVFFPRGFFARYEHLNDGSKTGWVRDVNIWCVVENEAN